MITTTFDPFLDALIIALIVAAPGAAWFWARNTPALRHHPADPFFGAVTVVAGLAVLVLLLIVLGTGVLALSGV